MDPEYMALCDAQYDMQHGLGGEPQHSKRWGSSGDAGPVDEDDSQQQQLQQGNGADSGPSNIKAEEQQQQQGKAAANTPRAFLIL